MKFAAVLMLVLALSGCASMSNRSKTLLLMAGSAGIAGGIGAALAPPTEMAVAHGVLWGGIAAAGAGVAGLFIFDEEARRKDAEAKAAQIERELAAYRDEAEPQLLGENLLGQGRPLPDKYRNLVTPGQWKLYKVDRWTASSESELVHQDLIFRFRQAQLNPSGPNAKPLSEKKP